jgi:hypothetical protein
VIRITVEQLTIILSSSVTLVGTSLTAWLANSKTLYRIKQLEKKQEKYNNLQQRVALQELRQQVADHRIQDLEDKIK